MKITIQGHPTRGKEVIQILESLGGKNLSNHNGKDNYAYYISNIDNRIYRTSLLFSEYKHYTLEEFKKEFPFKVGDRVISLTTGLIGTITKLKENGCYYIEYDNGNVVCAFKQNLKFHKEMKEERNITLTIDKAKEWYNKGGELREVALQAYSEEELTKVELPKTWEEFCKKYPIQDHEAFINYANGNITVCKECAGSGLGIWMRKPEKDRCKCVSQKSAEAHLALIQLEQLRDCWRQGWKPDWNNAKQDKYCISYYRGRFKVAVLCETRYFLSFPTIEMAEEFLECFRDLIEKARDLV